MSIAGAITCMANGLLLEIIREIMSLGRDLKF